MAIPLDRADELIRAAKKAATDVGESVSLAVVAAEGGLVAFARMDGAASHSIDTAQRKAEIAIALGFDTVHMSADATPGNPLFDSPPADDAHALVPNGGGIVLRRDGKIIGALGVSGATSSIADHKIGTAATDEAP